MCSHDESLPSQVEIEDLIPQPRGLIENLDVLERIVDRLVEQTFKSQDHFNSVLKREQKQNKVKVAFNHLLYVYRIMVREGRAVYRKDLSTFLKSKAVRGLSGVMVVTVLMSPWPKTAEEQYGASVQDVDQPDDPLYISKEELELGKQYKNFSCDSDCAFCPKFPGQARSYIKGEPAVARANQHRFDAIAQFRDRGISYLVNGHHFDKIELLILGGTFSSYPHDYQEEFIRDLYYAANTFFDITITSNGGASTIITSNGGSDLSSTQGLREKKSLTEEIILNETSMCHIIGLTLETRPDKVTPSEIERFRMFGATRIQIGVQHTDDNVLKYVNRGCYTRHTIDAIRLLKDNGFKVDIHLMLDLPSATVEADTKMLEEVLNNEDLQADQWKIYPCSVVDWTKIKVWYDNGKRNYDTVNNPDGLLTIDNRIYRPYQEQILEGKFIATGKRRIPSTPLFELLINLLPKIHPWIRVNRIIRDIPGLYVKTENYREDARQFLEFEVARRGGRCNDIRAREVRKNTKGIENAILVIRKYPSSKGIEYFISFENPEKTIIYGFLRLRISENSGTIFPELKQTGLIRELHVYGQVSPVSNVSSIEANKTFDANKNDVQHLGFGKKMIMKAEELTLFHGYRWLAVISGVGVRNYYRKQGYLDHSGKGYFQIKELQLVLYTTVDQIPCRIEPKHLPVSLTNEPQKIQVNERLYFYICLYCVLFLFSVMFFTFVPLQVSHATLLGLILFVSGYLSMDG